MNTADQYKQSLASLRRQQELAENQEKKLIVMKAIERLQLEVGEKLREGELTRDDVANIYGLYDEPFL